MGGGEEDAAPARPLLLSGAVLPWLVLTVLVPVAFAIVVLALNAGYYSAGGFVSRYLGAIERGDLAVALETPGVTLPADASRAALTRNTIGQLSDSRIVGDRVDGRGRHHVTAEYRLGRDTGRTEFVVTGAAPVALLFNGWRFADSPAAVLRVHLLHDTGFRIDGTSVSADAGSGTGEA